MLNILIKYKLPFQEICMKLILHNIIVHESLYVQLEKTFEQSLSSIIVTIVLFIRLVPV